MRAAFAFPLIPLVALTAMGQSGSAVPASFFGISSLDGSYPVPTAGSLGHPGFSWAEMESGRGSFDFSALDGYVGGAKQHGLVDASSNMAAVAFTLSRGTPAWAVADQTKCAQGVCSVAPDNLQDWKDFLTALLQRYNGVNQPHIQYYELWNEANNGAYWTGTNAQMVALAQAAFPIVHTDRYSQLVTPSVVGATQAKWMTAYLQAGGSRYADGGAFHGYLADASGAAVFPMPEQDTTAGCTACYGAILTQANQMRAVFDGYGLSGKPMLVTEGSWGGANLDDATETAWVARYLLLLAGMHSALELQMVGWYGWSLTSQWGNLGVGTGQPKPSGIAYSQVYNWLAGAAVAKACSSTAGGTWVCSFTRPGGYVAQAVWNTQGPVSYTPGLGYIQYRDLGGNTTALAADASLNVGPLPVLIEGTGEGVGLAPVISLVANAEGETPAIAPNTWIEIKGINLARAGDARIWQSADFGSNQMPAQMDGVSVTVNGKGAYLYYISPAQVNVLTPPDALSGNVPVQVTLNNIKTPAVMVPARSAAPALFVMGGGPYALAQHANGNLSGPSWLYPGITTPAAGGETIVLYGNGFGATSTPVQAGLPVQSGTLATPPTIQIGGVNATVVYAGLIGPGQFQFNVVVPDSLAGGDQPVTATYQGYSTQPGLILSIQP